MFKCVFRSVRGNGLDEGGIRSSVGPGMSPAAPPDLAPFTGCATRPVKPRMTQLHVAVGSEKKKLQGT